jgi:hypothetical protein
MGLPNMLSANSAACMSTESFRRRNPLALSGGLSYCVEEMTCEVRLGSFVQTRPIGWHTKVAWKLHSSRDYRRGETTANLVAPCVAPSRDQPLRGVSTGAYAVATK